MESIDHGSSGSGLFDESGRLLGVLSRGHVPEDAQNDQGISACDFSSDPYRNGSAGGYRPISEAFNLFVNATDSVGASDVSWLKRKSGSD
jgi:hypothetical protein